ncbi:MAG: rRNA pseudouridine synthase [Magnetococcus sp. WYHC-3]
MDSPVQGLRLQKWLADHGLCSRREGERWIAAGRVAVNGQVVTEAGSRVQMGDAVSVDGRAVGAAMPQRMVLALHKPTGCLCTRDDPQERPTVHDLFPGGMPRLFTVGRLDFNSEGLLLLTNDGALAHALTHPSRQVPRVYRVRVGGRLPPAMVARIARGVTLEDGPTGPLDLRVDAQQGDGRNCWVTMTLNEGRNRLIRRVFEQFELPVSRLIRISYGPITLGEQAPGTWRTLSTAELRALEPWMGAA